MLELNGTEEHYLSNDRIRAHQSRLIHAMNLLPAEQDDQAGIQVTPFSFGVMGADEQLNPGRLLKRVVDGQGAGTYEGTVNEEQRTLVAVSLGPGGGTNQYYRFDPDRGYLATHFWRSNPESGKISFEVFVLEAKKCGSGRWFPMLSIVVQGGVDGPWPKTVKEIRVSELSLEKPNADDFCLDVAAHTRVAFANGTSFVTIAENKRVDGAALEALAQQLLDKQNGRVVAGGPPIQPVRRMPWLWPLNVGLIIAGTAIFLLLRRKTSG
jgi:hypothetical protein